MNVESIEPDPPTLRSNPCVSLRILLAEDDDEMRDLLATALRVDGHEVVEVRDGRELVARTGPGPNGLESFDVVVSDVVMPGATGITVLSRLARDESAPPLVVITAFSSEDLHEWARAIGVMAVFDKPFDIDDLRAFLLNILPRSR